MVACVQAQNGVGILPSNSELQLDLRPSLEAVVWSGDTPASALLEMDDDTFFAPRFSLGMDAALGPRWFMHATARADRGFDPGNRPDGDFRLDELMLRWRPCDDQRLNLQIGKFPSAFGAWSGEHDFFDDPFLLAPLPYSQIIGINTRDLAAVSPAAISARAAGTAPPASSLDKEKWASVLWGPGYATGASVFGATEEFDYALELKNAALSSHPDSWSEIDFNQPTLTARFGWRPDASLAVGVSASCGSWLEEDAIGVDRDDLAQSTLGLDLRWSHHDLIVSGEVVLSEFETPAAGDLRTASWFLQARWKTAPGIWLAARFGQMIANEATGLVGEDVAWQPSVWRAEFGAGWRITPNLLLKGGYGFTHTAGNAGDGDAGEHLLGTGIGWRF
jgi:hypothetical protein